LRFVVSRFGAPLHIQVQAAHMRVARCCVVTLCLSSAASAQSVTLSPPDPRRWDVAGSVGWLGGNKSELAEEWNSWSDSFATSLDVGRYWTPHIKTEAAITFTGEGSVYSYEERFSAENRIPIVIPREHHFRITALSTAATYQFFENTWVHPFLSAGVQFTEERERSFPQVPFVRSGSGRLDIAVPPPRQATVFSVRPFASGGAKFYVNERGFIRTDLGVAWHDGRVGQVTWRAGIGVDF